MSVPVGIRGFADQARPPRLGKIRLGRMVPTANGQGKRPERTSFFVTDDDAMGAMVREAFGNEPTSLPIAFLSDNPDEIAPFNLEHWGRAGRKCIGDGESAEALVHTAQLEMWRKAEHGTPPPRDLWAENVPPARGAPGPQRVTIPCFGSGYEGAPPCPMYATEGDGCRPTMHLHFVIRELPAIGVWQLDTNSVMSIERVRSFLAFAKTMTPRLAWLPLRMSLEPVRARGQQYHVVQLSFDVEVSQAAGLMAGAVRTAVLALPSGDKSAPVEREDGPGDGLVEVDAPEDDAAPLEVEVLDLAPQTPPPPVRPAAEEDWQIAFSQSVTGAGLKSSHVMAYLNIERGDQFWPAVTVWLDHNSPEGDRNEGRTLLVNLVREANPLPPRRGGR